MFGFSPRRLHGSSKSSTVVVLWFSEKEGGFSLSFEERICDIWWFLRSHSRSGFDLLWRFLFFGRLHRLHQCFSDLWRIFSKFYGASLRLRRSCSTPRSFIVVPLYLLALVSLPSQ
ncbi:hypothetical protein V6N13_076493 [Hibiscus sabdariffa]|uniref:Uncharacterized protein n=2 Tax=Hibiscus sabdariffa TaxID=183260 RepID=A0ABR2AUH3_9ROSI